MMTLSFWFIVPIVGVFVWLVYKYAMYTIGKQEEQNEDILQRALANYKGIPQELMHLTRDRPRKMIYRDTKID